jgi:uncharacterized protein YndB with AHSA1/START domain
MGRQEFDIERQLDAPPAQVWRWLADGSTWPSWTPIDSYELVRPAGPDGTGEVRVFHNGRHTVREEIVEFVPERRLTYTLLAGLALRDYFAEIDLAPAPGGRTQLRWHTTFKVKAPGTGAIYRRALQEATRQFVDGLAAHVGEHALRDAS